MESEVDAPDPGQAPKHMICSAEEGRTYLEEEALIDPGEHVDMDAMAGTLVQVSLLEGIQALVSLTVRKVALILAQMKMEFMSETLLKMMEPKIDLIVGKAADKLAEMGTAAKKTLEDLRAATQGASDIQAGRNFHQLSQRPALPPPPVRSDPPPPVLTPPSQAQSQRRD